MKNHRLLLLMLMSSAAMLITACGAGSVKDPFVPTRIVVFGDNQSVTTSGMRYTVNGSGGIDNWTDQIASGYGVKTIVGNAQAEALISGVTAQIAAFGSAYQDSDLVLMTAGYRDVINLAQSASPSTTSAKALGAAYGEAIRNAVNRGAKRVLALNMYDFSARYAAQAGVATTDVVMKSLIRAFNDGLKINLDSPYVGDNVRLVDAEFYMNLLTATPASYGFTDSTTVVCTVTDPGTGIGLGTGVVNSSLCNVGNVASGFTSTYNSYVYADSVYLTPAAYRSLGGYAQNAAIARW
jgi:phospholipase/lecithinase/hemolysin